MLLPLGMVAQTADYTVSDDDDKFYTYQKGTWVFELGPDTLVGTNDTLIIDIPRSFYDNYKLSYFYSVDSIAGQDYPSDIQWELQVSPCNGCGWFEDQGSDDLDINTTGGNTIEPTTLTAGAVRHRLVFSSVSDYAQLTMYLVYKPQ